MNTRARALRQVAQLTQTYVNPDSAYVARSRLKRALLSALQVAAEEAGASGPHVPGPFRLPEHASAEAKKVVVTCNEIWTTSESLCQPSEALDVRWTEGWSKVMKKVAYLEECLRGRPGRKGQGSAA